MLDPDCENCPLGGVRVGARGETQAPIVFVGESPGLQEIKLRKPFMGQSGKVLNSVLPNDIPYYITNAVQCFPKAKDPAKMAKAAKCCNSRLEHELRNLETKPKIIVAMGNPAMWSLTGNYALKITQERGKLFPSDLSEHGIIPVLHPAALLRGMGSYRKFVKDIEYANDLARGESPRIPPKYTYEVPETLSDVNAAIHKIKDLPLLIGDIETGGLNNRTDPLLCLGVTWKPKHVIIFSEEFIQDLKPLFQGSAKWVWHNGKFDIAFLRREGLNAKVDEDTMLLSYCLDENPGLHDLEQVSSDLLGAPDYKYMVKPYLPKKTTSYTNIPKDVLHDYAHLDCGNTEGIFQIMRNQVKRDPSLELLYTKTLIPASELLYHVEHNGFLVDQEQLKKNDIRLEKQIEEEASKLNEIAGYSINANSPIQMSKLLYDDLGLKGRGRSTNKKSLEKLPQNHPAIIALKAFRKVAKARSTYVTGLAKRLFDDGRVHPTFLLHGTKTGRLACRGPNLQNIPRDAELRNQFIAPKGYILIEVDLNQAELRCLAALSGDEAMCEIYNSDGMSLHDEVATALFGPNWDSEQKMRAKAVNFGIVYGREAYSLAEEFNTSTSEGQRMINSWFARFPKAHQFIQICRQAPMKNQTLVTLFGRKKRFGLVTKHNLKDLQNEAANFPHQSIASDITLHAAIRVRPKLTKMDTRIVNLVHDSIVMEVPNNPETINNVKHLVIKTMRQVPIDWGITRVPFIADAKEGTRWGSLKKVA